MVDFAITAGLYIAFLDVFTAQLLPIFPGLIAHACFVLILIAFSLKRGRERIEAGNKSMIVALTELLLESQKNMIDEESNDL